MRASGDIRAALREAIEAEAAAWLWAWHSRHPHAPSDAWAAHHEAVLRLKELVDELADVKPRESKIIRVATQGWNIDRPATTAAEINAGIGVLWVEIDGVRLRDIVVEVQTVISDEFTTPRLMVEVAAPIELVYIGANHDELRSETWLVTQLPEIISAKTFIEPHETPA